MRIRTAIAVALVAVTLVAADPLFASHPFDTLSVRQVQAYRHVLEDDDRLLLVQYAMADTPPSGEAAYSFDAAVVRVFDDSGSISQVNPPFAGYGLVAFYWDAANADTLVPWQDLDVDVGIAANPTLFESPQSDDTTDNPIVWNSTASLTTTAEELVLDLPALLRSIETDDPDRIVGDYVSVGGITLDGGTLIALAFPQLQRVASAAFQLASSSVGSGFDPSDVDADFAISTEAAGKASSWTQDVFSFGATFGMPAAAAGLILLLVFAALLAWGISKIGGEQKALVLAAGPLMFFGAITGAVPFLAVIAILVLTTLAGTGILVQKVVPN